MLVVLRCFSFATCPSNLEQATVGQARAVPEQWPSIHQRGIIAVVRGPSYPHRESQLFCCFCQHMVSHAYVFLLPCITLHYIALRCKALSSCAVLLAIGPAAYCWLNQALPATSTKDLALRFSIAQPCQGRAELADTYRGTAHPLSSETDCCHSKEQVRRKLDLSHQKTCSLIQQKRHNRPPQAIIIAQHFIWDVTMSMRPASS